MYEIELCHYRCLYICCPLFTGQLSFIGLKFGTQFVHYGFLDIVVIIVMLLHRNSINNSWNSDVYTSLHGTESNSLWTINKKKGKERQRMGGIDDSSSNHLPKWEEEQWVRIISISTSVIWNWGPFLLGCSWDDMSRWWEFLSNWLLLSCWNPALYNLHPHSCFPCICMAATASTMGPFQPQTILFMFLRCSSIMASMHGW